MTHPQTSRSLAFPVLTADEIASLAHFATRRTFRDGEPLFEAGRSSGAFFLVLSGTVEIIDRSDKEPRTVRVHGPGEFTGDIDILTGRNAVVSAVARGDSDVLEIAPADVRRIIAERPTIGELILRAFMARRRELLDSGFTGVQVIGSAHSKDAYDLREFLSRNQVPVSWVDTETNPAVADTLQHFGLREEDLPAVACEGGLLMRNPSMREVAEAVGLKRPLGDAVYDLVVIGAGPAGLAAAVYGSSEGLRTLVLDAQAPGGQAGASMKIENYLGFPTGITGAELTGRATLQAQKFDARFSTPSDVTALEGNGGHLLVRIDGGESATARCVLIATGANYRRLPAAGRERFDGLGVYYAATPTELSGCVDAVVVVVGAGNSAGQAAVFLSEHTRHVFMLVRGDDLRKSMSSYLADRIEDADDIEVLCHTEIHRMEGSERLERVELVNNETGALRTIDTPAVFTFIGAVPCTHWLPPEIDSDAKGFIRTGHAAGASPHWTRRRTPFLLETSLPGVFAAGDVRLDSVKRVASAVGEGSMAVKFVHEFLAETP
ncbi:MAG: FAD-dependent oxidoreductase [Gemmatimonadaceae bacterium]